MIALDIAKQFANPVPATKKSPKIKRLDADRSCRESQARLYINATSTFEETHGDNVCPGEAHRL